MSCQEEFIEQNDKAIPYMELVGIKKDFGATKALQDMSLSIYPGEIIGIVGPNGAGKSTFMRVLTGVLVPTSGQIKVDGNLIQPKAYDAKFARAHGIACAYQELSVFTNLKVYENFSIVHDDHKLLGKLKWRKKASASTKEALDKVFPGNRVDVNKTLDNFTLAQRQMVEITRAMTFDGLKILILDEPTSSLTVDRINQLHTAMREISAKGVCVLYISHKLEEIKQISSRIIVMKNGSNTWECVTAQTSTDELVTNLGGVITKAEHIPIADKEHMETVLEVNDLATHELDHVDLVIKKGEIVGLAGLAGSGQKHVLDEIFNAGTGHKNLKIKTKASFSYISGDRQNEGVFRQWNIADNINISSLNQVTEHGIISSKKADALSQKWYDKLKFRAQGTHDDIVNLSGGNQQKALIARGIASGADVILLNDPTRGVDVETKQEIYHLLDDAKNEGKSIVLHSTEDAEMEICDRVYVMNNGAIVQELVDEEITVGNIVAASFKEKDKTNNNQRVVVERSAKSKTIRNIAESVRTNRATLPLFVFLVIFIVNGVLNSSTIGYTGIEYLFGAAIPLVFVALAQMFIVVAGDIDMSNGMAVGLINVISATYLVKNTGLGLLAILLFIALYAGMGILIHMRKIPSIVVTLGAMFVWLGLALLIQNTPGGSAPQWLSTIYNAAIPGLPMPIILCAAAGFGAYYILNISKYGMVLKAAGNNSKALVRSGWSYFVARIMLYVLSAFFIILAGLAATAVSNGSDANASSSYQMLSIATIILGGCEFVGGIGVPIGVVAAGLAISLISSLLTFLSINTNFQSAVTGFILLAALTVKLFNRKKAN